MRINQKIFDWQLLNSEAYGETLANNKENWIRPIDLVSQKKGILVGKTEEGNIVVATVKKIISGKAFSPSGSIIYLGKPDKLY